MSSRGSDFFLEPRKPGRRPPEVGGAAPALRAGLRLAREGRVNSTPRCRSSLASSRESFSTSPLIATSSLVSLSTYHKANLGGMLSLRAIRRGKSSCPGLWPVCAPSYVLPGRMAYTLLQDDKCRIWLVAHCACIAQLKDRCDPMEGWYL